MKEAIPDWCQIACEVNELAAGLNARGDLRDFESENSRFEKYDEKTFQDAKKWWQVFHPLFKKLLSEDSGVKIATLGQFNHPSDHKLNRTWMSLCSKELSFKQIDLAKEFASCLREEIQDINGGSVKLSKAVRITTDALDQQSREAQSSGSKLLKPFCITFSENVNISQDDCTVQICTNVEVATAKVHLLELLKAIQESGDANSARGNLWLKAMSSAVDATTVLAIPGWLPPVPNGVHTGVLVLYLDSRFDWGQLPGIISAYRAGSLMYLGVSEREKFENSRKARERLERIGPELDDLLKYSREVGDRASAIRRKLDPSATKLLRHDKEEIELLFCRRGAQIFYLTNAALFRKSFSLTDRRDELKDSDKRVDSKKPEDKPLEPDIKELKTAHSFDRSLWKPGYSDFFVTASHPDNWNEPWMEALGNVCTDFVNEAFNFAKLILHRPLFEERSLFEAQLFFASWYATCWATDERPSVELADSENHLFLHEKGNSTQLSFDEFFKVFGFGSEIKRRTEGLLSDESHDALLHPGAVTSVQFLSAFMDFLEELSPGRGSVTIKSIRLLFSASGAVVDIRCNSKLSSNALTITPTSSGRGFRGALGDLCEGFNQSQLLLGSRFELDDVMATTQLLGKLPGFYWMDSEAGTRFLLSFTRRLAIVSKGAG